MAAFGGKADNNHQAAERPLLAISGHKAEGWKPEILRKQDVRKAFFSAHPLKSNEAIPLGGFLVYYEKYYDH